MESETLNTLRLNVLDSGSSIVASNRTDLLELVAHTEQLIALVPDPSVIKLQRFHGLAIGIRNAPENNVVYHSRLHLLEWLDAIDQLTAAVPAPAPEAPPAEPQPAPDETEAV